MRSEREIREKLKEIEEKVKCSKCGAIGVLNITGEALECPVATEKFPIIRSEEEWRKYAEHEIKGSPVDLGWYQALKWVLADEEVEEVLRRLQRCRRCKHYYATADERFLDGIRRGCYRGHWYFGMPPKECNEYTPRFKEREK